MSAKQKETTESQRKIIMPLHNEGKSYAKIGGITDRSRFTIRNIVRRFEGQSNFERPGRSGRPRILTDHEGNQKKRKVKQDPPKKRQQK